MFYLKALVDLVEENRIVNPFKETSSELVTLDSCEVMNPQVENCLREAPCIGKSMYTEFVQTRLDNLSKPLSYVIPRIKMYTFSSRPPVDVKKSTTNLSSVKSSAALTTKLFVKMQARLSADIDDFFMYKNQREPPSLSNRGKLLSGTKSALIQCIPGMDTYILSSYFI